MKQIPQTKSNNFYKFLIFLGVIFVIAGATFYYYKIHYGNADLTNLTKTTVHLKWQHSAEFAGMYMADSNKLYGNSGLSVKFVESKSLDNSGVQAVVSGKADYAVVNAGELLDAFENNQPVKAVAVIYQNTPIVYSYLAESGINEPKDLENKVLGVPSKNKYPAVFYDLLLKNTKVPINSVSYKDTGLTPLISLKDHKVDVALAPRGEESFMAKYRGLDIKTMKPEDYGIDLYDDIIITSDKKIEQNPNQVSSFVKATLQGWDMAIKNPDEAVAATLPHTSGLYKDIDMEKDIAKLNFPLVTQSGKINPGTMDTKKWLSIFDYYNQNILTNQTGFNRMFDLNFF